MEKYSVLMSVYAKVKPDELDLSINSMMKQTLPPDEFILVWDGPIGNELREVIEKYDKCYLGVFTVIKLEKNFGLAYALNKGLEIARNDLVARMDSDDYSLPNRCEMQVKTFEEKKNLVLLGTNIDFFKDTPNNIININRKYPTELAAIKKALRRNDPFSHPTVMYKKSFVLTCGGYDSELRRRQDYDLFSKMVVHNNLVAANLPDKLLLFRADENYHIRNKSKESCNNRILIQKKIYKRGDCTLFDYFYVWFTMNVSKIMPLQLYKAIYTLIKK